MALNDEDLIQVEICETYEEFVALSDRMFAQYPSHEKGSICKLALERVMFRREFWDKFIQGNKERHAQQP